MCNLQPRWRQSNADRPKDNLEATDVMSFALIPGIAVLLRLLCGTECYLRIGENWYGMSRQRATILLGLALMQTAPFPATTRTTKGRGVWSALPSSEARISRWLWIVPPAILLLVGFAWFASSGFDDPYITYAAAWQLAHHGAILNYSGDRVEMSSSLLLTLILAAATRLTGLPLPTLGYILSISFGLVAVTGTMVVSERLRAGSGLCAGLLAALSLPLLNWTFGGMEAPLVACLWLWLALSLARGSLWQAASAIALTLLVRPEMSICLPLLATLGLALTDQRDRSYALRILAVTVIFAALLALWREMYFGSFMPQPVTAKAGRPLAESICDGAVYFWKQMNSGLLWPLLALACLGAWQKRQEVAVRYLVGSIGVYGAFIVASGGDWMGSGRFLVPVIPATCVLASIWRPRKQRTSFLLVGLTLLAQCTALALFIAKEQTAIPFAMARTLYCAKATTGFAWFDCANRVHVRDMGLIRFLQAELPSLEAARHKRLVIASVQMGMVPYYTVARMNSPVTVVDFAGLQDRTLTNLPYVRTANKHAWGIDQGESLYFRAVQMHQVPAPDVVYLLNPTQDDPFAKAGYRTIYAQSGSSRDLGLSSGRTMDYSQAILVSPQH